MQDLLVIGADSRIGRGIMMFLRKRAIAVSRQPSTSNVSFDLVKHDLADIMMRPEGVSHALILAGITNPREIVANPAIAYSVNVEGTLSLINRLFEWGIVPIFFSSDAVLGAGQETFDESSHVSPATLYGQMKRQVEEALIASNRDWLIFRLARVYGLELNDRTFITSLFQRLLLGGNVPVASNQKFTPIYFGDLIRTITRAIDRNLTGLYHLGGPQVVTHFEVANLLVSEITRYRTVKVILEERSINDFVKYETRPTNIAMNSSRIRKALGLEFMTVSHACHTLASTYLST